MTKFDAIDWADSHVEHVGQNEGFSPATIPDRGPQVNTAFVRALASMASKWTACHFQAHGQTERANTTMEDVLLYIVSPDMTNWIQASL